MYVGNRQAVLDHEAFSGVFRLSRMDLDRDLDVLHTWMNDPEVARFWKKQWSRERVAAYLLDQHRSAHSTPYLGTLDGIPMSYWELYRADLDPLADHYPAREHDAGLHLLLGPAESRGRGLAGELIRVVTDWQFEADSRTSRVVAEPDVANARSVRVLQRAGFHYVRHLDLPGKKAVFMIRDRERR